MYRYSRLFFTPPFVSDKTSVSGFEPQNNDLIIDKCFQKCFRFSQLAICLKRSIYIFLLGFFPFLWIVRDLRGFREFKKKKTLKVSMKNPFSKSTEPFY